MDLIAKLPEMSDDALSNLRANARRLQTTGSAGQRSDAATLLTAVEAEIGARRMARAKPARTTPARTTPARTAPAKTGAAATRAKPRRAARAAEG